MSDHFHSCAYCGVDCEEFDPEHKPDCPSVTNLWPVTEHDLGIRGPNDPYAHGMRCMDCGSEFAVGDIHTHRQTDSDVFEVVCLGCSILNPSEYQVGA